MGFENVSATLGSMQTLMSSASGLMSQFQKDESSATKKDDLEEQAKLAEINTKETVRLQREDARKDTKKMREEKQRRKARARAMWGQSGIGMVGSPLRVMESMDVQTEKDVAERLGQGEQQADRTLARGREQAQAYRDKAEGYSVTNWVNPFGAASSIIGMGKKIYDLPIWQRPIK